MINIFSSLLEVLTLKVRDLKMKLFELFFVDYYGSVIEYLFINEVPFNRKCFITKNETFLCESRLIELQSEYRTLNEE